MGTEQRPQSTTNRSGSQQQSGSSTAAQDTERVRPIAVARENDSQVRGGLAPSRSGLVGYGPSGTSQVLMRHMADDIDQLLQLFGFGGLGLSPAATQSSTWSPQIEIGRQDGNLVVRADLPGVTPDDVQVEVDDGVLTISGERREERTEGGEGQGFYRSERRYGSFYRSIPLPEGVKAENANASFRNGVLEITMDAPQLQSHKRRLEISEGGAEEQKSQAKTSGR